MKTLIAYASKHGTTKKAVEKLAEELTGDVVVLNLEDRAASKTSIEDFNRIIIGGSIYIGKIQKSVRKFSETNLEKLLNVEKLGLFICCGSEDKDMEQLLNSFSDKLIEKAEVKGYFGYGYDLKKLGFIQRTMLKKAAGVEESESNIKYDNISKFAEEFERDLELR